MAEENLESNYKNNKKNPDKVAKGLDPKGVGAYKGYLIPDESFSLPEMGDFYLGAVDDTYLKILDRLVNGVPTNNVDVGDGKEAAFYTEAPSTIDEGVHNGKALSRISADAISMDSSGWTNARCLRIPIAAIENSEVKSYILNNFGKNLSEKDSFTLTTYGINAPYPARWAQERGISRSLIETSQHKISEIKNISDYTYDKSHSDDDVVSFVKVGSSWREMSVINEAQEDTIDFDWLVSSSTGSFENTQKVIKRATDIINRSNGETYVLIDTSAGTTRTTPDFNFSSDADAQLTLKQWAEYSGRTEGTTSGYCLLREDNQTRLTGSIYVKIDGKWINLTKAILEEKNDEVTPNNTFVGEDKRSFAQNYSSDKQVYADAYFKLLSELDDRRKIQQKIFNMDWSELHKWTVTVGDVTFFCPPTNISVVTQTEEERVALLRASGSMPKSGFRSVRNISMRVYFLGARGINGYRYEQKHPNGKSAFYALNGLRALISHYKFAPFVPIENDYINNTLGILAVTLDDLSVHSIPGHPQLLFAEITMTEFEWSAYLPNHAELSVQLGDEYNWFSSAFNWAVFRYYYQKPIMAGDYLYSKGFDSNSQEYLKATLENRTALEPMIFKDPSMKFFIADPEYLDELLLKKEMQMRERHYNVDTSKESNESLVSLYGPSRYIENQFFGLKNIEGENGNTKESSFVSKLRENNDNPVDITYVGPKEGIARQSCKIFTPLTGLGEGNRDIYLRMNDIFGEAEKELKAAYPIETSLFYQAEVDDNNARCHFGIRFRLTESKTQNSDTIEEVQNTLSPMLGMSTDRFYQDGWTYVSYSVLIPKLDGNYEGKAILSPDMGSEGQLFTSYLKDKAEQEKNKNTKNGNAATDFKLADNVAALNTLKFIPYTTGSFVVDQFSISTSNRFSRINLQDIKGSAPQFLGGNDVVFDVSLTTTDSQAAAAFSDAPKQIAAMMRKYRRIIPCCPFKVDSEFTRLFGVHEVSINNVEVATVPNQPGVYKIHFQAVSMDRTMRSREALRILEANNSGLRFDNATGERKALTYFDTRRTLEKTELYPDLELPTLQEMGDLGYAFVRYKFQDDRVYVDPDFYFVYVTVLYSQILRETVIHSVENGVDGSVKLRDATGAEVSLTPSKFTGYSIKSQNKVADKQFDAILKMNTLKSQLSNKILSENLEEDNNEVNTEDFEGWDICNDIKAIFLEKRYQKEYDSFIGRIDEVNEKADAETQTKQRSEQEKNKKIVAEGAWVSKKLESSRQASKQIKEYLEKTKIDIQVTENVKKELREQRDEYGKKGAAVGGAIAGPIGGLIGDRIGKGIAASPESEEDIKKHEENVKEKIKDSKELELLIRNTASEFFQDSKVTSILELLNFDMSSPFRQVLTDIVYASACAGSGEKEFSNKKNATNWRPDSSFKMAIVSRGSQDISGVTAIDEYSDDLDAITFGVFGIQAFTKEELEKAISDYADAREGNFVEHCYVVDPYYRTCSLEEFNSYRRSCAEDPRYCTVAFCRNLLFWIRELISVHAIPSINGDILRQTTKNELQIQDIEKEHGVSNQEKDAAMRKHLQFFSRTTYALDAGKMWTAAALALSNGSPLILNKIEERDYRALNEYAMCCSNPATTIGTKQQVDVVVRKLYMALVGLNRITDKSAEGVEQDNPMMDYARKISEMKYIEAAEDPSQFMVHACHDMIVHDARGRMLRAFPTYYMMFIDEGRDVGLWHLHDNFYNNMAIMEFSVVKDRKNPADTLILKMSNLYQSFSTEGEDRLRYPTETWSNAFQSVFSPTEYGKKQEERRKGQTIQDRIRIRPGARIHLRAGYGSSAAMLPVIFNGSIAEVNAQDTIELTAQGDGIELVNPIIEEMLASELTDNSKWDYFKPRNNVTPLQLMHNLLTSDGGFWAQRLKSMGYGSFVGDNPYGIYHFGDKDFKSVIKAGEPTQNIYQAWNKPVWGGDKQFNKGEMSEVDEAPVINIDLFNKSVWDVANICKSVVPDFICGVAPFNLRSTLFIGAPRYYYAYDYVVLNGAIQEKRKPYQQYHVYTSSTDIVSNGIVATAKDMKTTATGLYEAASSIGSNNQKKVGPLFVDIDIYPENQKSMIVDTQLYARAGLLSINAISNSSIVDKSYDAKGDNPSNDKLAWRMTASALKDSVKEMYAGDMIILGDPTIKPHDRVYIVDSYQGISGQATVKEVVHTMSAEAGFTTTVSPDCINTVDDPFEVPIQQWFDTLGSHFARHALCLAAVAAFSLLSKAKTFTWMKEKLGPSKATMEKVKSAASKVKGAAKDLGEAARGTKAATWGKNTATALKETKYVKEGVSLFSKIRKGLMVAMGVGAATSEVGIGIPIMAGAATALALTAGVEFIAHSVTQSLSDYMKNLQVITVFPLKRYNLTWTAGMAGSKGLVYGDPTFLEQGKVTEIMTKYLKNDNTYTNKILSSFVDEDALAAAEKLRRDEGVFTESGDPTLGSEVFMNTLRVTGGAAEGNINIPQDYRRLIISPRADYDKQDEVLQSYEHFAMKDVKSFQDDPKFKNNILISDDRRLVPYIKQGFFKIIHETPALNKGKFVDSKIVTINDNKKYVKTIENITDGGVVYDIPLLNRDALDVLYELIRKAKMKMPAVNASDPKEVYEETKTSFIALESALRIGEKESQAAAGFTFILQGVDLAVDALAKATQELLEEVKEQAVKGVSETSIFDSKDLGNNKICYVVRMPRVSSMVLEEEQIKKNEENKTPNPNLLDNSGDKSSNSNNQPSLTDDPDIEAHNANVKRGIGK